jgi:hypothetical protein
MGFLLFENLTRELVQMCPFHATNRKDGRKKEGKSQSTNLKNVKLKEGYMKEKQSRTFISWAS